MAGPDLLRRLTAAGVAVWLDDLSRQRIASGGLAALVDRGVVGVTTNPTIFAGALAHGDAYAGQLGTLAARQTSPEDAVTAITTDDVRAAADVLREVYERTAHLDGRVSLEVDPRLARDGDRTRAQAEELWARVDRPNLFIKIPATAQGLPAIAGALGRGISVNVTLIFSVRRYREVLDAHARGLEDALAAGRDVADIGSVASFFVSRVDGAVDPQLDALGTAQAAALRGQAAVANARLAYGVYLDWIAGPRWQALAAAGARPQRPLWASTGVKDPRYRDTRYVDELVARDVVNTMPEKTLEAVADHGRVDRDTITPALADARDVVNRLAHLGIDLEQVAEQLEDEGVTAFEQSWQELLASVRQGLADAGGTGFIDGDPR